jgi:hypothetical protein
MRPTRLAKKFFALGESKCLLQCQWGYRVLSLASRIQFTFCPSTYLRNILISPFSLFLAIVSDVLPWGFSTTLLHAFIFIVYTKSHAHFPFRCIHPTDIIWTLQSMKSYLYNCRYLPMTCHFRFLRFEYYAHSGCSQLKLHSFAVINQILHL